jgi:DNA-binding NtrC family response regulator
MAERILIVDDDPVQRRLLENMVVRSGYEAAVAEGGDAALKILSDTTSGIDCVVLDLVMPDLDGLGVLAQLRELDVKVPVIVQTAHGGIDNVISAMRAGATDFVVKPVGAERLQVSIRNAIATATLEDELGRVKRSRSGTLTFKDIVTRSARMHSVLRNAEKAAASNIPVLIEGESGVGKELIARAIHGSGERRAKPLVALNCGAIPDNLVESILFGHEKGAFTGATERHVGKFLEADGGTLFLDEVGELPAATQVKLLRAIQEGEIEPVGARKPVKVDVRVISATNRDLLTDVKAGRFREDLFYRLHVFPVAVPPLRERREDIPELVRHFMARLAAEEGKRMRTVTPEALTLLCSYPWPGNVRQLENTIFRAVVLAEGEDIGVDEIPQIAAQLAAGLESPVEGHVELPSSAAPPLSAPHPTSDAHGDFRAAALPLPAHWPAPAPVNASHMLALLNEVGEVRALEDLEAEVIRFALTHYRGQMSEVARKLKIGRSTLYRKLDSLGLATDAGEATEASGELDVATK